MEKYGGNSVIGLQNVVKLLVSPWYVWFQNSGHPVFFCLFHQTTGVLSSATCCCFRHLCNLENTLYTVNLFAPYQHLSRVITAEFWCISFAAGIQRCVWQFVKGNFLVIDGFWFQCVHSPLEGHSWPPVNCTFSAALPQFWPVPDPNPVRKSCRSWQNRTYISITLTAVSEFIRVPL